MRGIYYNSKHALCSIWESGKMCYDVLKNSDRYILDYTEDNIFNYSYDFAIVNEHMTVNNWITAEMKNKFNKPIFCIVTEVTTSAKTPIGRSPPFYTAYLVLDPSISDENNIYGFARPLENITLFSVLELPAWNTSPIPIIGSFGFATLGKDWLKIIEQVQHEFDEAIIRFNIPQGTYVPNDMHYGYVNQIKTEAVKLITKPNISLSITSFNYTKEEIIEWCSKNTINIFFYFRHQYGFSGLSAVTDQAIVSERPLLVTNDPTFRHIHKYIKCYPEINIKQAINETSDGVKKMKNDWTTENFLKKFEYVLSKYMN